MLNPTIHTFIEVAESGSFSSAAEKLYISKVSVMNQINALEASVGIPLMIRSNHGVTLTEAGQSFYRNARRLQRLADEAIKEARKIGGKNERVIRIGTSMMRPCNKLVELWETMEKPQAEFQFNIVPFHDGAESLNTLLAGLGEKIDCFVTPCSSMKLLMDYNFMPIGTCQYQIAMSKKHKLACKSVLQWNDLQGESLLLVKRGESYVVDDIRDEITRNHSNINVIDFNGYYDATTFNMCEQMGYLMGTMDLWNNLHPSLVTLPVDWNYEMPYGILYAKEPNESIKEFISSLVGVCDK